MPHAFRIFAAIVVSVLLAGAAVRTAHAAELVDVFIDARDPAFVVVQGIAIDAPEAAKFEMRSYTALDGVSMVSWDVFRQNAQAILAPYVVKDEYPESRTVLGVVTLVKDQPGKPFALTWNGGLAASFQDFQHAVSTFQAYTDDPGLYETSRPTDVAADPLFPDRQLQALLNR